MHREKEIARIFPTVKTRTAQELSTFGVGKGARFVCSVSDTDTLLLNLQRAHAASIPYKVIAGGSNLIFPDELFETLLFVVENKALSVSKDTITSDAGVPLAHLIETSIQHSLSGLETLSGIPGTVGGALVGNAGAYGKTISDHLVSVRIFDGVRLREIPKLSCEFSYRESVFKRNPWTVISAVFQLPSGNKEELIKKQKEILELRLKKYKPGILCPGSFFKNVLVKEVSRATLEKIPPEKIIEGKIPAGYLLEASGACGTRCGGVYVATFHGNLLINDGAGTCHDVCMLADDLKTRVQEKFDIELSPEVRFLANL